MKIYGKMYLVRNVNLVNFFLSFSVMRWKAKYLKLFTTEFKEDSCFYLTGSVTWVIFLAKMWKRGSVNTQISHKIVRHIAQKYLSNNCLLMATHELIFGMQIYCGFVPQRNLNMFCRCVCQTLCPLAFPWNEKTVRFWLQVSDCYRFPASFKEELLSINEIKKTWLQWASTRIPTIFKGK